MDKELNQIKKLEKILFNYRYYKKMIQAYKNRLEQDNTTIKGISYDQEKTQSTNKFHSDVETSVLKNEELQYRIYKLQKTINDVDDALNLLDSDERIILQKYYIDNLSWIAIIQQVHIGRTQCFKIRNDAIDKMQSIFFSQVEDKGTGNIQFELDLGVKGF
ncbi:hypothetical protein [Vallitalea guaymasensis]|uniref:hypothetical protein n=1 Tax=Vallitalea guaymasensis TaxID=1185412 RepID=UPI00235326AC|nr:hypothetical protein [Vallitalea guaymasensis]